MDILPKPPLIGTLFDGPIDVVGDIHGEMDALRDLLQQMGYNSAGQHPDGRRLVFVGDLTDRGPDSPAVIEFVSKLVARGLAQSVLGNHELNLLRQARKEGNGWHFEDNHDRRDGKFATAKSLPANRRQAVQTFLQSLPLALERSDLRLVHAAWHAPSIAEIRKSTLTVMQLYEMHESAAARLGVDTGLVDQASSELATRGAELKNPAARMTLLPGVAALDALYQDANPVRILTSGVERIARVPFFASGKWRMVDRVRWWDDYRDATPVIIGHYWRWPTHAARSAHSRGEPDLFAEHEPHHWFGAGRNVFCVDFAVGARYKERTANPNLIFQCRLGAVRWPERELVLIMVRESRLPPPDRPDMWQAIRFSLLYAEYAALIHQARWMQQRISSCAFYGRRSSSRSSNAEVLVRKLEEVARHTVAFDLPALSRGLQECVDPHSTDRALAIIDKTSRAAESLDQLVVDLQITSWPSLLATTLETGARGVHLCQCAISHELEPIAGCQPRLDFGSPFLLVR